MTPFPPHSIHSSVVLSEQPTGTLTEQRAGENHLSSGALPWIVALVVVAAMAVNPVEFNTSADFDRATSSTGPQTFIKLAIACVAFGLGVFAIPYSPRTRRLLASVPGVALLALGVVFCVTSVFAVKEVAMISRASALLYVTYVLFAAMALATLGPRRLVAAVVAGASLYLLFTWGLLALFPERGQFIEYTSATESVTRMGGTGHPNNIAKIAICMGLMALAMAIGRTKGVLAVGIRGPWRRIVLTGVILLAAATVFATMSRTAVLAGTAAAGMLLIDRLYGRGGAALAIAFTTAASIGVLAVSLWSGEGPFSESAVGVVTKSGDVEELTSLTGRTVIWEEAVSFITQRPLTGFGLDSAASVMSKRATGTHNLLLHMSFSSGIAATVLMTGLLAWSLIFGATSPHEWIRAPLVYVLVSGLVEDTILESFPTTLTLLWMIALLAPTLITIEHEQAATDIP